MKKWIIFASLFFVVVLLIFSFVPIKMSVYADKDDTRRYQRIQDEEKGLIIVNNRSVLCWFTKGTKADNLGIIAFSDRNDRPKWLNIGKNYIGDVFEYEDYNQVYYRIENNPILLNQWFYPSGGNNSFAIKYLDLEESEKKQGYYEQRIFITDWVPTYPIQRSGWLASRILPKDYLVIWDFIGPRAVSE